MNNKVGLIYDTIIYRIVNGVISNEKKVFMLNCNDNPRYYSNQESRKFESWAKHNIDLLFNSSNEELKNYNFEISWRYKRKYILDSSYEYEKVSKVINVFNKINYSFNSIIDFNEDYCILSDLEFESERSTRVTEVTADQFINGILWSKNDVATLIKKFLQSIYFENIIGNKSIYSIDQIDKRIFNKYVSISILPTEPWDDQGYPQEFATLIHHGVLKKLLCLNINIPIDDRFVGGYVEIDHLRRSNISIGEIKFDTREIEDDTYLKSLGFHICSIEVIEGNIVQIISRNNENKRVQFYERVENIINSLVYNRSSHSYYFIK